MPIYEYQGKHYDIDTDDVQVAKSKILATMAPPESAMPKPIEGAGGAAFGIYRPAGRRPESQQNREAAKEMPLQTARGLVTGTLGAPADILNLPGTIYSAVSGNEAPYKVPMGSEDWNKLLPLQSETPHANLARFAGEAIAPFPTVKGAQAVAKGVARSAEVLKDIPGAIAPVTEFGKGVYGGAFNATAKPTVNPANLKPWETPSARMPVGETYIPADVLEQYRSGLITPGQAVAQARPVSELPQAALARTQGMVPYEGQVARATGEHFGAGYRDPYKLAAEAGADYFLGGIPTLGRLGMKGYDVYQLGKAYKELGKAGFSPLTAEEFAALSKAKPVAGPVPPTSGGFPSGAPTQPLLPYSPAGQTPIPMAGPGRRVGIEGESYNLPYQIDVSNAQTARPQTFSPATPTTSVKPVALESLPQAAAEDLKRQASKQKIKDMIEAKTNIKPESAAAAESAAPTIADWAKKKTGAESAGTGEKFADTIEQHRQAIIKEKESRNLPAPDITDAAVVKSMIKQTGNGAVTQSGKRVSFNSELYDDLAGQAGVTLDWSTAPDITNLDRASTRTAINDWVYDAIREQRPDLGLGSRGPQMRTQQAAAERELGITGKESMGAEEIAALQQRAAKLLGKKYKPPGTMEMMTPESKMIHNSIEDAAGKIAIEQMTNNNGMFETMYKKGKDTISEVKYPNYHGVEITHADGSKTIMKKQAAGYSVTDVPPKDKIEYTLQKTDKFGIPKVIDRSSSKPDWWHSVEDQFKQSK